MYCRLSSASWTTLLQVILITQQGKGGLPESILVGKDKKIILDCNFVFCVKEAQVTELKSRIDALLSVDHNPSTSLWVSSAPQSIEYITKRPKEVRVCLRLSFLIILCVLFISFKSLCCWM